MKDVIERNDELTKRLAEGNSPDEIIAGLIRDSKRSRHLIWVLATSIVLEIVLFITLGYVIVQQQASQNRLNAGQASLLASCKVGNDFRTNERALWGYLLSLPAVVPPTQAQQEQVAAFNLFLDKTFALRDCSKL